MGFLQVAPGLLDVCWKLADFLENVGGPRKLQPVPWFSASRHELSLGAERREGHVGAEVCIIRQLT